MSWSPVAKVGCVLGTDFLTVAGGGDLIFILGGDLSGGGDLIFIVAEGGDFAEGGDLTGGGDLTWGGDLTPGGDLTLGGDLIPAGDLTLGGDLIGSGDFGFGEATVSSTFSLDSVWRIVIVKWTSTLPSEFSAITE